MITPKHRFVCRGNNASNEPGIAVVDAASFDAANAEIERLGDSLKWAMGSLENAEKEVDRLKDLRNV